VAAVVVQRRQGVEDEEQQREARQRVEEPKLSRLLRLLVGLLYQLEEQKAVQQQRQRLSSAP
jgi:hypothetical protein